MNFYHQLLNETFISNTFNYILLNQLIKSLNRNPLIAGSSARVQLVTCDVLCCSFKRWLKNPTIIFFGFKVGQLSQEFCPKLGLAFLFFVYFFK